MWIIIALILMFSNSTYSGVLADDPTRSDLRSFEFSFSDLSMKLYTEIIPLFDKKFWFIHLLIAFSLYIINNPKIKLYILTCSTQKEPKKPRRKV